MKKRLLTVAGTVLAMNASVLSVDAVPQKIPIVPEEQMSWLAKSLEFSGVALKDDDWHIWGCSPIVGPEGKIHIFTARWPEKTRHGGWYTDSQVAHYVSDAPEGPFVFSDVVVTGTGQDTWDKYSPHNPAIHKVGDQYALFYIANTGTEGRPANQKIGLLLSDSLYGPWEKVGTDGLVLSPPDDSSIWSYESNVGVNNPAFMQAPDGQFFLYYKARRPGSVRRMGLAIADKIEGPYIHQALPLTDNEKIIEDGYVFTYNKKVYMVTTDNHGMMCMGGGILWESEDGLRFSNPKNAFNLLPTYLKSGKLPDGVKDVKSGPKFERPQVLMLDGKPVYMYMPCGVNLDGGNVTQGHALRIRPDFLP